MSYLSDMVSNIKSRNLEKFKEQFFKLSNDNSYLLQFSCTIGALEILKFLVANDIDPHADAEYGFRIACCFGHLDVITYLVSLDVQFDIKNNEALEWAHNHNHPEIVEYLNKLLLKKKILDVG